MNGRYCNGMIYVVKKGDTLYGISRQFRVPLALLLRANPYVDVYNLQVGTEICIPMGRPNPMPVPPPKPPQPDTPMCPCQPMKEPRDDMPQMEQEETQEEPPFDVEVTDGKMSLGEVLEKNMLTLEEFNEINDLGQMLLAKDVVIYLPKKV